MLFVPNSNDATLLKKLEQREPLLTRMSGFKVRLVEASGVPLSRLFSLDLSSGRCQRWDCHVCRLHKGKGSSKCMRKSIVYESRCLSCPPNSNIGVYIGESGRSLYERSTEHLEDAKNLKKCSHIVKHWALQHPTMISQPVFKFSVLKVHKTPMDRQIHEAVRIGTDGKLNSKSEFRQNQIKRLAVQLTSRELRAVERELEKEDIETQAAIESLTCSLKSNKISGISKEFDSNSSTGSSDVLIPDLSGKRKGCDSVEFKQKRLKMGRSSKGNTKNESNTINKFVLEWDWDGWQVIEKPRTAPATVTPMVTSFAEASALARSWYSKRGSWAKDMPTSTVSPIVLGPLQSVTSDSSSGSDCNDTVVALLSPESPVLSPMSSLDKEQEGKLSIKMLELTVDAESRPSSPNDSFGSSPGSSFNKGALEFLSLVDKAMKKAEAAATIVGFDSLVVDMMSLGVDDKVSTSAEILDRLNSQGWNAAQVSQV